MADFILNVGADNTRSDGGSDIELSRTTDGLRSSVVLDLFTDQNWFGNLYLNENEKVGNGFNRELNRNITTDTVPFLELELRSALTRSVYRNPTSSIQVRDGNSLSVEINFNSGELVRFGIGEGEVEEFKSNV